MDTKSAFQPDSDLTRAEQELQQRQVEVEEKIKASPRFDSVMKFLEAVRELKKKNQPVHHVEWSVREGN